MHFRSSSITATWMFTGLLLGLSNSVSAQQQHAAHAVHETKVLQNGTDTQMIEHVMKHLFDKPQSPLTVGPVVVEGDYAVAGWLQDERGGRALLQKQHGTWSIMVCGGDGLRDAAALVQTGMGAKIAHRLVQQIQQAEAGLPVDTLKKFASFTGIVNVQGHADHQGHGGSAH